jgi:hypothetical protein
MMDIAGNINKTYIVDNNSLLLNNISKAICVVLPESFVLAGLDDKGTILSINQFETKADAWDPRAIEPLFQNRSLQKLFKDVVAVFVACNKYMAVPKTLYSQGDAEKWMNKLYFEETSEVLLAPRMKDDKTQYLFYIPADIKELLDNNLEKHKTLPLAAYQFHKSSNSSLAECCITATQAYATLYNDKQLVWHMVFDYTNAEDIAYKIKLAMRENGMSDSEVKLKCGVTNTALAGVATQLETYFATTETGSDIHADKEWKSVIYLLQQLNTCA